MENNINAELDLIKKNQNLKKAYNEQVVIIEKLTCKIEDNALNFAEWLSLSQYILTDFKNKKWLDFEGNELYTTKQLYNNFLKNK